MCLVCVPKDVFSRGNPGKQAGCVFVGKVSCCFLDNSFSSNIYQNKLPENDHKYTVSQQVFYILK